MCYRVAAWFCAPGPLCDIGQVAILHALPLLGELELQVPSVVPICKMGP